MGSPGWLCRDGDPISLLCWDVVGRRIHPKGDISPPAPLTCRNPKSAAGDWGGIRANPAFLGCPLPRCHLCVPSADGGPQGSPPHLPIPRSLLLSLAQPIGVPTAPGVFGSCPALGVPMWGQTTLLGVQGGPQNVWQGFSSLIPFHHPPQRCSSTEGKGGPPDSCCGPRGG